MDEEPQIPFLGIYGSHSPQDSFFENLLSFLNHEIFEEVLFSLPPKEFLDHITSRYNDFLKGCHWNFKKKNEDSENALNYFKYVLQRFKVLEGVTFNERDDKVYHISLQDPISLESEGPHKVAFHQYEYMNKAIIVLEDYVNQLTPKNILSDHNTSDSRTRRTRLHGFKIKNKECLNLAFDRLKFLKLIHHETRIKDFESAFLNWIPENKIIWQKGPGLLSYFIKSINGKGIEDEKKNIWKTTTNCFINSNLKDFSTNQLRFAKKPTKLEDINLVIKVINKKPSE